MNQRRCHTNAAGGGSHARGWLSHEGARSHLLQARQRFLLFERAAGTGRLGRQLPPALLDTLLPLQNGLRMQLARFAGPVSTAGCSLCGVRLKGLGTIKTRGSLRGFALARVTDTNVPSVVPRRRLGEATLTLDLIGQDALATLRQAMGEG